MRATPPVTPLTPSVPPCHSCCPARLFICLLVALVSSLCGVAARFEGVWFWFSFWVCIFIAHKRCLICFIPIPPPSLSLSLSLSLLPFHYLLCFCCCCFTCCAHCVAYLCPLFLFFLLLLLLFGLCLLCGIFTADWLRLNICFCRFSRISLCVLPYLLPPSIDLHRRRLYRVRLQICNCYWLRMWNMFCGSTG